jgi:NAD(P)-dependent dehydrogenase (short-subunit alcohol dehydrogenase family)
MRRILITGVSSGLGHAFAEAALAAGHAVAGTVRKSADAVAFEALNPTRARAIVLDVTHFDKVAPTVDAVEREFGPIDVLVNNAGYGHEGTVEESPLEDLQRQFEVNVFGAVAMMKAVLPWMRGRRHGRIVNITSMAGLVGLPGVSYYSGSKFALEGISESLDKEVSGLGIRVTAVAPGSFRTDWAGRSMVRTARSIADYDAVFDPIRQRRQEASGHQAGDPARAAQALLELIESASPPRHLVLGDDALVLLHNASMERADERAIWERVSRSTAHD